MANTFEIKHTSAVNRPGIAAVKQEIISRNLGRDTASHHTLEEALKLVPPCNTPARVLVAEDNAMIRLCLIHLLEKMGVSFVICKDGREAWDALNEDVFDIALVDLQMPYLDGSRLVSRLRDTTDNTNTDIPVVALTGSSDTEVITELFDLGVTDCLVKPFEAGDFFRVIRQHAPLQVNRYLHFFSEGFDDELLIKLYDNDYEHLSFMFSLFLTNTPKSVQSIQTAVADEDWSSAQQEMHKIKPTFAMVGLRDVGQLANQLERKLSLNVVKQHILNELDRFYRRVDDSLHAVATEQRLLTNYLK